MPAANPLQGEINFETRDGQSYQAVFDIDAVCAIENMLDRPIGVIVGFCTQGRVGYLRAALWAGLRQQHPKVTLDDAGRIMRRIKGAKALDIVLDGLKAAFPQDGDDDAEDGEGGDADPLAAPGEGGTGKGS